MTAPLTPPDCDLRAFRDLPLDIGRFRDSQLVTHEEPEAVIAALLLWGVAWHQVPAASLPDDDKLLARYAGYGRAIDQWLKVRDGALRGFVLCDDGRLYHRVLAEKACSSWDARLKHEWTRATDRHRKGQRQLPENERTEFPGFDDWKAGRTTPQPTQSAQQSLPLEGRQTSTGTASERAPATRTERARTGSRTVPSANSSGTNTLFQRNEDHIPVETALKGREGKGILVDSTQPIESVTPAGVNDADLMAKFEAVCEACGFRPVEPGQISRNLKVVQDWIAAGYDFDTVVLPTIRKVVADAPDGPTRTLGRFRTYISHAHAQQAAQRSLGRKPRPPARAPDPPILAPPGEGDFRELRTILLERMGPDKYSLFANPIRFEDAGETAGRRPLRIRATPHLAEAWTSGTYASVLRNAARQFGFTEVWA